MSLIRLSARRPLLLGLSLGCCVPVWAAPQPIEQLPLKSLGENRWQLPAGDYAGQFVIKQAGFALECAPGARFDGQGQGSTLLLDAEQITVQGCQIDHWGRDLGALDSAVFVSRSASNSQVLNNRMTGQGFGVWLDSNHDVLVEGNHVEGDPNLRSQDRGNAYHLYNVTRTKIFHNYAHNARDGIYIDTSHGNFLEYNTLEDVRYGVHYMFANNSTVIGNITRRTRTGYALMQSRNLTVTGNRSEFDQNYGILMNYITYSVIHNNFVTDVKSGSTDGDHMIAGGEGKALFIYNSLYNDIRSNHFQNSPLGIHLTAGSEENPFTENSFVANQQQVKYVASRTQEWSVDGRGNFWSDYLGWDRNNDGLGDVPYEPNDNVDRLLWMYPQVRLLMNSPSIELLRWVQRAFPVMKSPGVKDSYPLMKMPTEALLHPPKAED